MTERGTGGAPGPGSTPADGLDEAGLAGLGRTSPRRAARLAEERRRAEVFDQEGDVAAREPQADDRRAPDAYPDAYPQHDGHAAPDAHPEHAGYAPQEHDAYPPADHDAYVGPPVGYGDVHDGYAQENPDAASEVWHDDPAVDPAVDHADDPFGDPREHEVFGDPVSDGYVPVVERPGGRRRRPRWVGLLTLVVVLGLVGGAGWASYQALRPVLADIQGVDLFAGPEDYTGAGTGSVEVVVAQGESGSQIGRTLRDAGVVASVEAFLAAANANPDFTRVQPGTYTLPQQLPAVDAVTALLDPANRQTDTLVIAEGLRVGQILDRLAEGTGLPREELQAALDATELPAGARQVPGLIDPAEGFLYPDGYQFGDGVTAEEVISTMIARGQEELTRAGVPPERQLEVLTKASLVQGEARLDEDFGKVAQVVENRLAIGQPLGLDSTVNYATQTFDTRTTAEQRASESPYNTYAVAGLPPGPIKSPGRQAIEAVVSPTPGPWLYFVTVDLCTGQTAFAESYDEHLANVDVLDAWQRENTDDDGNLVCG